MCEVQRTRVVGLAELVPERGFDGLSLIERRKKQALEIHKGKADWLFCVPT